VDERLLSVVVVVFVVLVVVVVFGVFVVVVTNVTMNAAPTNPFPSRVSV